jgi:PAS domain S-box-containing protein
MTSYLLNRTQDYLDIAGVIIVVIKPDETVELINKRGCEVLGYTKEQIEGQKWFDQFVPHDEREESRNFFKQMLRNDDQPIEYFENAILTKKNEIRIIQWHNAYLRNDQGEVIAILSSGEDTTTKKVLQSRLAVQESEKRKQILAAVLEAQENERHDIAYELHDNVNQILTTCKILLESEIQKQGGSEFVKNSYQYLQNAIDEIRNLSHRLNPAQLEDIGLEEALREMIRHLELTGKFDVQLAINDPQGLKKIDYHISLSIFRIIQEQINNIIKYADASFVRITIELSNQVIDVEINDNGKGFNPKTVVKGLGLANIRNRAEFHRGTSYVSSAPGEGCILSVCLPLA